MAARTSSNRAAPAAVLLGLLAILAVPAGVAASKVLHEVRLIEAVVVSVPVGFVLSLVAIALARRARFNRDRSVFRPRARTARVGRFLAWTGMYLALTGALALAFYGVLRWTE